MLFPLKQVTPAPLFSVHTVPPAIPPTSKQTEKNVPMSRNQIPVSKHWCFGLSDPPTSTSLWIVIRIKKSSLSFFLLIPFWPLIQIRKRIGFVHENYHFTRSLFSLVPLFCPQTPVHAKPILYFSHEHIFTGRSFSHFDDFRCSSKSLPQINFDTSSASEALKTFVAPLAGGLARYK